MKFLLDTHIWLWMVLEPARLKPRVARVLDKPENELWLSPIAVWELLVLIQKGRVRLNEDPITWAQRSLEQLRLREAPLTFDVALETYFLKLTHSDPADRFIVASAKVFDLTLVTADEKLLAVSGVKVLPNH
jgi:PIN domain nuclease of toxin-antitoxin system